LRKKKPNCPFYGKNGHAMLQTMDVSTGSKNQCGLRLDGIVPCAMEVQMNETPNHKRCPLIQRVRELWSLMEIEGLDIEGLDDTLDDFSELKVSISIFTFQDDEEDDDLPVGATQCPRCRHVYAGVSCPNCFMQSGLAQLR
jgi:hypothetical protein